MIFISNTIPILIVTADDPLYSSDDDSSLERITTKLSSRLDNAARPDLARPDSVHPDAANVHAAHHDPTLKSGRTVNSFQRLPSLISFPHDPSAAAASAFQPPMPNLDAAAAAPPPPPRDSASSDDAPPAIAPSPPNPVTDAVWYTAVLEKEVVSKQGQSLAKRYPKIWSMVTHLVKYWVQLKWEVPCNTRNHTDLKRRIVRHVITARRPEVVANVDCDYLQTRFKKETGKLVMFYHYNNFLLHASQNWKIDQTARNKRNLPTVNDHLRIFGILSMERNRDDVMKLARGKAMQRSDLDDGRPGILFCGTAN